MIWFERQIKLTAVYGMDKDSMLLLYVNASTYPLSNVCHRLAKMGF